MNSQLFRGRARPFNASTFSENTNCSNSEDDWGWGESNRGNNSQPTDNFNNECFAQPSQNDQVNRGFLGRGNSRGISRGSRGDNSYPNRSGRGESHMASRGGRRNFENTINDSPDESNQVEMLVPKGVCGRIIGKAGSKISELQSESGANIKVNSQTDGNEASIHLTGTQSQCDTAKRLIDEIVTDSSRPYNRERENFSSSRNNGFQSNRFDNADAPPIGQPSRGSSRGGRSSRGGYSGDNGAEDVDASNNMLRGMKLEPRQKTYDKDEEFYPIIKSFYKPVPEVANISKEDRDKVFESLNNILVKEFNGTEETEENSIPNPISKFEHAFGDYPAILEELKKQGFDKPSPIQCMSWPVILSGRDFIGIAQTGSGKTLAFLLPAFLHIEGQKKPRNRRLGPTVLVLSPTRELALQIMSEVNKYSFRDIRCVCIYGGGEKRKQLNELNEDPEIVVATPGRLNDLLDANQLNLADVSYLVLDEADRMLDMGFEPQVVKTLWGVRKERQTIMTSATWPASVHRIAKAYMESPIQVNVGSYDLTACHDVLQRIEMCHPDDKRDRLLHFVTREMTTDDKVLVFVGKKADCGYLCADIQTTENSPSATCIHGDLDQDSREDALASLREGYVQILVATDLASRGIDIKDITYVFNYDFPRNIEEYVHRVGRTGRAGRKGVAISLMTRGDARHAEELIEILEEAKQIVPDEVIALKELHEFRQKEGGNRFRGRGRGRGGPRY